MKWRIQRVRSLIWTILLLYPALVAQQEPRYTIRVNSDLIQINVAARDQNGGFVRNLSKDDFLVEEDGRAQQISGVDMESVVGKAQIQSIPTQLSILTSVAPLKSGSVAKGSRLVLLFFDFTSLDTDEAARSLSAAKAYIGTLGASDRVAVVSLAARLEVLQDFTGDQTALQRAVERLRGLSRKLLEGTGNEGGPDSAYGLLSGYRRLRALRVLTSALAQVPQKKSVVIFAGNTAESSSDLVGITATLDAAVRAGVSFYGIHAAGLTARPPLGDATQASSYSTAVLSGTAVAQSGGSVRDQDLLYSLARGTGGRAFFDSNDFERPFRSLEDDTREYYMLSYRSSNSRRDGHYRRISVRVRRRGITVNHQPGYYGPREGTPVRDRDTDQVVAQELATDLPATGLPVFGFVNYLRAGKDLLYVPILVAVPADALTSNGDPSSAAVAVVVMDGRGRAIRNLRDVIPASVVPKNPTKPVLYETAAELPSGEYMVRIVVVQNGSGQVGSYSTAIRLPGPENAAISVSPLLSGTLAPPSPISPKSPLVVNGTRLMLNPLAEYNVQQRFTVQYQVDCGLEMHRRELSCDASQIQSSLQCFSGDQRVFKTEPSASIVSADRALFRVEFPAGSLPPGTYKCRVTAINPKSRAFAFGAAQVTVHDAPANPSSLIGQFPTWRER